MKFIKKIFSRKIIASSIALTLATGGVVLATGTILESPSFFKKVGNEIQVISPYTLGGAGIASIVEDLTPQLGGDLDLNGHNFDFPTTPNISDVIDDDTMAAASATVLATSESVKAYIDNSILGFITASSTNTFTNKTFDANGTGNSLSNVETADIASGSKSGADAKLITGTTGTNGNIASWNVDGDLVDGSLAVANIIDTSDTATTSASGISELATSAEVTTGSDTGRTITPSALSQSEYGRRIVTVPVLGTIEQCTVGDGAGGIAFRVPAEFNGWNLVAVGFGVTTAGTTGNFDIQIRNATKAVDMLTTKMRVETGETDTITSAQPGTINTSNDDVSTGDKIFFDIDACQNTPAYGAILSLSFQKP